jgi:cellulose synthase/poly-beta-1,6-N-acetylglucosamine synthase-like glycosyltransferase
VNPLLLALVVCVAAVWLPVFGYALLLVALLPLRRSSPSATGSPPRVAVVIPTLNEAALILEKLANTDSLDYPADLLSVWVVDGGSDDGTTELVRDAIDGGARIRLLCVDDCRGKLDQLRAVLDRVEEEYLVVTDADAELAPTCVRELVGALGEDPKTGLIGATVVPSTGCSEERLHWHLLNTLWWLEGEVLSAAAVSGVCYAVRRSAMPVLSRQTKADDIHLAMAVASTGHRARISRRARAVERRVPNSLGEALRYRRRRGSNYLRELVGSPAQSLSVGWRIVRLMRLIQIVAVPWLAVAAVALAVACLWTEAWATALASFALLPASLTVAAIATAAVNGGLGGVWSALVAVPRHAAVTWFALLFLVRNRIEPMPERSPDGLSHAMADGDSVPRSSLSPPASL